MPYMGGCAIVLLVIKKWFECIIHYTGKGLTGWGDGGCGRGGFRGGWWRSERVLLGRQWVLNWVGAGVLGSMWGRGGIGGGNALLGWSGFARAKSDFSNDFASAVHGDGFFGCVFGSVSLFPK